MSGCNAAFVNSSDVRLATSAAKPIRHGYSVSRLDSRRLVHLCTIPAPVGPATSFSSRSFPHQRNYIGSYVFCVDEITTWRPKDNCGHWFRQTWLLKSFNKTPSPRQDNGTWLTNVSSQARHIKSSDIGILQKGHGRRYQPQHAFHA